MRTTSYQMTFNKYYIYIIAIITFKCASINASAPSLAIVNELNLLSYMLTFFGEIYIVL